MPKYDYKTRLTVEAGGETLVYYSQEDVDSILAQIKRPKANPILVRNFDWNVVVLRPELCPSIAVRAHE